MPRRTGREYRAAQPFTAIDDFKVEGYATTFTKPYQLGFSNMSERVLPTAFRNADMSDVIFQMNHDGIVMARMSNGSLTVEADEFGLKVVADLSGCQQGRELHEAIECGLMTKMSWGFVVADGGWEYDESTRTSTITDVAKVFDVSAVSIPADVDTTISARSEMYADIERLLAAEQRRAADERARAALAMELGLI